MHNQIWTTTKQQSAFGPISQAASASASETNNGDDKFPDWTQQHQNMFGSCFFLLVALLIKLLYHQIKCWNNLMPESCVFILFGSTVGYLLSFAPHHRFTASWKPTFTIDLFFNFLLPPIMLESAYSLNHRHFYRNIVPILLYAVVGTLLNIATIGPTLYALLQLNYYYNNNNWLKIPELSLLELLMFGTALSAIDPVSVLAIFKDLRVKRSLYYLVFGESLLNDAVVLVVHQILLDVLQNSKTLSTDIVLLGMAKFVIVCVGSLLIGIGFGTLSSLLTKATKHVKDVEPILLLLLAYTAYISAELFEWSGVVSIIGCGLMQAEFAFQNISPRSRSTLVQYIKALRASQTDKTSVVLGLKSATADVVIFTFLGMVFVQSAHQWNAAFLLCTLFCCILYRALSVLGLTYMVNHLITTTTYVPLCEQLLMVHAGLRGAIAYVLISMLNNNRGQQTTTTIQPANPEEWSGFSRAKWHLPQYRAASNQADDHSGHIKPASFLLLQTTTLFIILVTVFLMGGTTKPLLKYLQIKRELVTDGNNISGNLFSQLNKQLFTEASNTISKIVTDRSSQGCCLQCFHIFTKWLNKSFFKRILVRKSKNINENYFDDDDDSEEEEEEEEEEADDSDSDNERPSGGNISDNNHNNDSFAPQVQGKYSINQPPLSMTNVAYQRIMRKFLAKQLRYRAKIVQRDLTCQSMNNEETLAILNSINLRQHERCAPMLVVNSQWNDISTNGQQQLKEKRDSYGLPTGDLSSLAHIKCTIANVKQLFALLGRKICLSIKGLFIKKKFPARFVIEPVKPVQSNVNILWNSTRNGSIDWNIHKRKLIKQQQSSSTHIKTSNDEDAHDEVNNHHHTPINMPLAPPFEAWQAPAQTNTNTTLVQTSLFDGHVISVGSPLLQQPTSNSSQVESKRVVVDTDTRTVADNETKKQRRQSQQFEWLSVRSLLPLASAPISHLKHVRQCSSWSTPMENFSTTE